MSDFKETQHGRNHRPGGSDPIPTDVDTTPPATAISAPVYITLSTLSADGKYNAFPYLCVTHAGAIVASYREGTAHVSTGSKVVIQTSTDLGATWSAKVTLVTAASGHDVRDPSICCTATGRLIINYFEDISGSSVEIHTIYSDDDGATWSSPVTYTPFDTENATSGGILQHSSGVLIMPVYGQDSGDTADRCAVMRSSDNGATWSAPIYLSAASGGYSEMTLIEFEDASVAAFVRNNDSAGHGFVYRADSTNAGVTWTSLASLGFAAYPGRPAALLFPATQAIILWYRNTTSPFKAVFRYSFDGGATWSAEQLYSNAQYDYAGGYALGPNLVGVVVALEVSVSQADVHFASLSVTGSSGTVPDATGVTDGDVLTAESGAPVWEPAGGDVTGPYTNLVIGTSKVTSGKIAAGAVTTAKLATDAVTANEIAAGAVGASELASTAVTPGTYGDATHVAQVTIDADGRATAASAVAITGVSGDVAGDTHAASSKTTPINADEFPIVDTAASNVLKKVTFTNLKAFLKSYFDTLYSGAATSRVTYLSKPAGNITRAATSVGAFSTAWQITGVVVAAGQNVKLTMSAASLASTANANHLFAFFRGGTQIAARIVESAMSSFVGPREMTWIDENPGAGTYTYEVQAAMFTSGTLTVYQTNITTNADGGSSIFIAEVYTP